MFIFTMIAQKNNNLIQEIITARNETAAWNIAVDHCAKAGYELLEIRIYKPIKEEF